MNKGISMRSNNKGLTVKVNLWSMETMIDDMKVEDARFWLKGQVHNAKTNKIEKFNDPGKLLSILSDWNVEQYKYLKKKKKSS